MEGLREDEGGSWVKWTQDQNLKGSIPPFLKKGANCKFELNWVTNSASSNLRFSVTGEKVINSIFKNDPDSWVISYLSDICHMQNGATFLFLP